MTDMHGEPMQPGDRVSALRKWDRRRVTGKLGKSYAGEPSVTTKEYLTFLVIEATLEVVSDVDFRSGLYSDLVLYGRSGLRR